MFSTSSNPPRLLVFAGPNGSGKSTVTKGLPIVGLYVNADEIKKRTGKTDLEAAIEAEQIRAVLLEGKKDFTFETVLSTSRNLDLMERAKALGYQICVVFVITKDSRINVERVHERAAAGGHNVPDEKVVSRYEKSIRNIHQVIKIADLTRIIDNSGSEPTIICEVAKGRATIWPTEHWSKNEILSLLSENT